MKNSKGSFHSALSDLWCRYPKSALTIITLACLLPFADKAIHIDDPLFIWAARQIQMHWSDPYGFQINWYGWPMPMHEVTKNPPLASAAIALVIGMFGENELALHLSFLVQAIALILGTYVLATRVCPHPMHAGLATLVSPGFMVSSTTLMCDVLMVAFWVWSLVFWIRGLDRDDHLALALAVLLATACALTKYFGIALVPLLLVYSVIRNRKVGSWLLYLLVPVVALGLYEFALRGTYGHGLVFDAFHYANQNESRDLTKLALKGLTALAFTGGCCAIIIFLAPQFLTPKAWIWVAIALIALVPVTWISSGSLSVYPSPVARIEITLCWTILALGGVVALGLSVLESTQKRTAESVLLLLWIWGTFAFCILNWTINARSILPMVPAVAILILRRLDERAHGTFGLGNSLTVAAILALFVCVADYRWANAARSAIAEIRENYHAESPNRIWFQGHWGFQYYAQASGWEAFDWKKPELFQGDLMVVPLNNTNVKMPAESSAERIATIEVPVLPWVATLSRSVGAGFYTDIVGPLPFSFGAVQSQKYYILRIK